MPYLRDPGEQFASDTHRRVLGHLTTPDDQYGWSLPALFERMRPDASTDLQTHDELAGVLGELEKDGHAHRVQVNNSDIWKMTPQGFETLTGPIANEPPPGAAVVGPAVINAPGVASATRLDGENLPAGNQADLESSMNAPTGDEGQSSGPGEQSVQAPESPTPEGGQQ